MITDDKHILVVDDESRVRDLMSRALTANGFRCDTAEDGEQAFRMACKTPYDGVVTDLRMPHRHGHALCGDLLRLPDPPGVIVLTALSDPRLVGNLMSSGVHDVVHKPVNFDVLAAKVQVMVMQKQNGSARTTVVADAQAKPAAQKANLLHHIENTLADLTSKESDRLDEIFDYCGELPDPPPAVQNFIRELAEKEAAGNTGPQTVVLPGHESRVKERVTCYTNVVAVPMDRDWRRAGDPFKLALRDLSESGGRLLHTRALNSPLLALRWNATQLVGIQFRIAYAIRRCAPCGRFYDYGGQFLSPDD